MEHGKIRSAFYALLAAMAVLTLGVGALYAVGEGQKPATQASACGKEGCKCGCLEGKECTCGKPGTDGAQASCGCKKTGATAIGATCGASSGSCGCKKAGATAIGATCGASGCKKTGADSLIGAQAPTAGAKGCGKGGA